MLPHLQMMRDAPGRAEGVYEVYGDRVTTVTTLKKMLQKLFWAMNPRIPVKPHTVASKGGTLKLIMIIPRCQRLRSRGGRRSRGRRRRRRGQRSRRDAQQTKRMTAT